MPINPKKYSYKEFDNEKKFLRLENSPPSTQTGPVGVELFSYANASFCSNKFA